MIQAVLFDLDGVLIRTDELHYRSWQELAEAEGIPFDRTVNQRLRGVGRLDSLAIILERAHRRYDQGERLVLADRKNATYRGLLNALASGPGLANRHLGLHRRRGHVWLETAPARSCQVALPDV